MKALQYFLGMFLLVAIMAGCKKENNTDLSLLETGPTPSKLSVLFTITQDNSGVVTIYPSGEGASYYEVFFGDNATIPASVLAGANVKHTYAEGNYTVKVRAHSLTGQTTEITKTLTVSFRAPENLVVSILRDAANRFKINVSATALYETYFKITFGDVVNEVPQNFLEGQIISHIYAGTGNYTVTVVALSGGAATTTYTQVVSIKNQISLPVTFENPSIDYSVIDFGGTVSIDAIDPTNPANNVKKTTKPNGAETWAGTTMGNDLGFTARIPFTASTTQMSMKVYSPAAGIRVRLKVEDHNDATKSVETEALTTAANTWQTLIFDFAFQATGTAAMNLSYNYDKASVFFDFGTAGNGKVFYWDDVKYEPVNIYSGLQLPLDFQSTTLPYNFIDFGGAASTVVNNPHIVGINTSSKVGALTKGAGAQVWAGSFLELGSPISFNFLQKIKMKVWVPAAGIVVKFKMENLGNPGINIERDAITTVANGWEDLTFDFTGIVTSNNYQRVVVFFDFGNGGTGATYFFDDIRLN
jgi:hypothetical protein